MHGAYAAMLQKARKDSKDKAMEMSEIPTGFENFSDEDLLKARAEFFQKADVGVGPVSREDVIGLDYALCELDRYVTVLEHFSDINEDSLGMELECGVLLYGPPGTGKTFSARYLASLSSARFIDVQYFPSRSRGKFLAQDIEQLFGFARAYVAEEKKPVILFWDEFDAYVVGESEELRTTVARLQSELSGIKGKARGVFVVATTNRPSVIPGTLLRKGRIGARIDYTYPSRKTKRKLLEHFVSRHPHGNIDYDSLVLMLKQEMTPIDIETAVNESWQESYLRSKNSEKKNSKPSLLQQDIITVLLKRLRGPSKDIVLSPEILQRQKRELSGSALVARTLTIPVQLIAITRVGYESPHVISEISDSASMELRTLSDLIAYTLAPIAIAEIFEYEPNAHHTSIRAEATRRAETLLETHGLPTSWSRKRAKKIGREGQLLVISALTEIRSNNKIPTTMGITQDHLVDFSDIETLLVENLEKAKRILEKYYEAGAIDSFGDDLLEQGHFTQNEIDFYVEKSFAESVTPAETIHRMGFQPQN